MAFVLLLGQKNILGSPLRLPTLICNAYPNVFNAIFEQAMFKSDPFPK